MDPQNSPMYLQKSPVYAQKRPTHFPIWHASLLIKSILLRDDRSPWIRKTALCIYKRALCMRKRALWICKRGVWTCKRDPLVDTYHCLCCGVLQCCAVCCSVLQCATVACLSSLPVCCSVLQRCAVCCSVLQRVAVCCRLFSPKYHRHVPSLTRTIVCKCSIQGLL